MIQVDLRGRLGNQMFQYAILRVVAEKKGYKFSFNNNWRGKNYFDIDYGEGVGSAGHINRVFDEGINSYNPEVFNIKDNTLLGGYWQSPKYFEGYESYVKNLFKLKKNVLSKSPQGAGDKKCVIHFRGGDYFSHNYVPTKEWYYKARSQIVGDTKGMEFVVVTDDPRAAATFFPNDKILSDSEIGDFCLLSKAKYKILSPSTFSWWAFWLSSTEGGITIAPNNWLNHTGAKNIRGFYPLDIKTEGIRYME